MNKQADSNKVINNLINRIGQLEKENAVLLALLQDEENKEQKEHGVSE